MISLADAVCGERVDWPLIRPNSWQIRPLNQIPDEKGWLQRQPGPVIACGNTAVDDAVAANADVLVCSERDAGNLQRQIDRAPHAALVLAQVLRAVEYLPIEQGLVVESLAYASLQASSEFSAWLSRQKEEPRLVDSDARAPAIELQRRGAVVTAELNRAAGGNSISVEMRDELIRLFELMLIDHSIEHLVLSARGRCFSIGGELREFGLSDDAGQAHYIRTVQSPARLLAQCAKRVYCRLHGACIGSGIELPAFADRVVAERNTFFQLPELKYGLIPGAGGCVSMTRRIGRQRTALLALSGRRIGAETALEWGLIDDIVE